MPENMLEPPVFSEERTREIVAEYAGMEGPLIPILHALNEEFGHVNDAAVALVASSLNLTRAEVHGVLTFYHDFRRAKAGRHVLKICRAEACQSMGSERIAEKLLAALGVDWHGTTRNGEITVEPVYCLGLCACGPAALLDEKPLGRFNASRLEAALLEAREP